MFLRMVATLLENCVLELHQYSLFVNCVSLIAVIVVLDLQLLNQRRVGTHSQEGNFQLRIPG